MDAESRRLWEALKKAEFAVGTVDSGYHTFVISRGVVFEVHWDKGPSDKSLITTGTSLEKFFQKWGSGVIAVPPGMLSRQ